MSRGYKLIFNSKLSAALKTAINCLDRIEDLLNCDGDEQLSVLVNEQVMYFFDHLTQFNYFLLMLDNSTETDTTPDDPAPEVVPGPVTSTSNVQYFGVYSYSSFKCRRRQSNVLSITIPGVEYTGGTSGSETNFYLSNLLGTNIYYAVPDPVGAFTGIVLDRDQINRAICELRNHYKSIDRVL